MLRILQALFKHGNDGQPSYRQGPIFDTSGAGRMIFQQETNFPAYQLRAIRPGLGARAFGSVQAIEVAHAFRPLQTGVQVYINKRAPVAGLGGIQAGQIITAPLMTEE